MPFLSAGLTDIGQKRNTNQDAIYLNPQKNIFIVADGMGGHKGGDIASNMAIMEVSNYLLKHYEDANPVKIQREAVEKANHAILEYGTKNEKLEGMGTTLVCHLFKGPHLYISNVGDSRSYLIHQKELFQLTSDHSLVQEKLNLGFYTREQAAKDVHKNILVRAVGFEDDIAVDIYSYKVHPHDIFLSCSDGLHGKVSDSDLLSIINTHLPDPPQATQEQVDHTVQELVDQANRNGGNDNISVVVTLIQ